MSLILTQLFPTRKDDVEGWVFNHDQEHRFIIQRVFVKTGIRLTEYILEPFNYDDPQGWLARHQSAHNDFNAVVKFQGNDLQDVDFKDEKQRIAWSWFHWQEHVNANTTLGIIT